MSSHFFINVYTQYDTVIFLRVWSVDCTNGVGTLIRVLLVSQLTGVYKLLPVSPVLVVVRNNELR